VRMPLNMGRNVVIKHADTMPYDGSSEVQI
jgi:hypothetical protein